nr:MAG TPA: hypothetical protein [Bacteriophage sp.]
MAIDKQLYMCYFIIFTFNRKHNYILYNYFYFIYNHARYIFNCMQYNFTHDY